MKLLSDRSVLVIAMIAGIPLVTIGHHWFHADRRNFERHIHVGQTAAEVRSLVGTPNKELLRGDELAEWGSAPARAVNDPTWVYFVFPASQHRFVITLRENEVAEVAYAAN
jgi:hypothetical protein